MKYIKLKASMFFVSSMALLAGCSTYGNISEMEAGKYKIVDKLLAEAKEKNLGIVLMPTFTIKNMEGWNLEISDLKNERMQAQETKMIWRHRDDQNSVFLSTTRSVQVANDSRASWMLLGSEDHIYQIFFVKPGIYGLIGSETLELDKTMKPTGTQALINKSTIGQSFVEAKEKARFVTDVRWSDARYRSETRSASYCTLMHASGTCMSSAERKYKENIITRPAGYYKESNGDMKPALVYTNFMTKPLAKLEVKAGEVIFTDSFFAIGKNVNLQEKSCMESKGNIQCSIDEFHASLIRYSPENYQSSVVLTALSDKNVSKELAETLSRAQYRPLEILGKIDYKKKSKIGDVYTLR